MKHLKTITFAVMLAGCSAANAMAEETDIQAPDVSNKLDRMVESKMDELVKETHAQRGYFHIVEYSPEGKVILETAVMETLAHGLEENRS